MACSQLPYSSHTKYLDKGLPVPRILSPEFDVSVNVHHIQGYS